MVVVVIFATTAALAAVQLQGDGHRQRAVNLARSIQFALLEARTGAVSDGYQRRLTCTASGCTAQIASTPGTAAPATWNSAGDTIQASATAQVWAITATTDVTTQAPAGPLAATTSITFSPDGSASPATVYVRDKGGPNTGKYKVYVYSATGMARMVEGW
jgi:Tfp pilus assembly protein FimT